MMVSVILAHPDPKSLNHAIAATVVDQLQRQGHLVLLHDLYAEQFDPILPSGEIPKEALLPAVIAKHCREIAEAEGIVIIHPNWWGQPPAILKGWVDRVLRVGVAYEFLEDDQGEGIPVGLLKAQVALVLNTSNTPADREQSVFGDPLENLWKNCIFELCGIKRFYREMFRIVVVSSQEQRQRWLNRVRGIISQCFPVATQEKGKID